MTIRIASHGFVCPITRISVAEVPLQAARDAIAGGAPLATRNVGRKPIGETESVLLRADGKAAYPIVSGIPILLGPELLAATVPGFDLFTSHYAEAYSEIEFYDAAAASLANQIRAGSLAEVNAESIQWLDQLRKLNAADLATFPFPLERWLASRMDLGSEWDCYQHIGAVSGQRILQVGGTGIVAVTLLLAGAAAGSLLTPMLGEAKLALALADAAGVPLQCVVGIAEELPFPDGSFDVVSSAGCVHHMTTEKALPEIARVLSFGGRFAAVEPWRAPLYAIGTRVFGKREANAFCRPLTRDRVAPLFEAFPSASVVQHGTLSRYPMLALEKFGARFSLSAAWTVSQWDDNISSALNLRRFGSGVALLGRK